MIGAIRFFSALAAKQSTPKLSHEIVGSFLQVIERNAGLPSKLSIGPDQKEKNRSFSATLRVPLPNEIRDHFSSNELTVFGTGKS